jgi:DNA (cytosine-5)-methyltransferase 1
MNADHSIELDVFTQFALDDAEAPSLTANTTLTFPTVKSSKDAKIFHDHATSDALHLTVHGYVSVMLPKNAEPQVAQIQFIYQTRQDGPIHAHVRLFAFGRDTILQEVAGNRQLFLLDACKDVRVEQITSALSVVQLTTPTETTADTDAFYYRFWYDPSSGTFEDAARHVQVDTSHRCASCRVDALHRSNTTPRVNAQGELNFHGQVYHVNDCVYITDSDKQEKPYDIARILEILDGDHVRLRVQLFQRHDDWARSQQDDPPPGHIIPPTPTDNRRLILTNQLATIDADSVDGKCVVLHISDITDMAAVRLMDDLFYFAHSLFWENGEPHLIPMDASVSPYCAPCRQAFRARHQAKCDFIATAKPLVALDIFAGCGGLSSGLKKSGVVDTRYAIEFFPSAALTFSYLFICVVIGVAKTIPMPPCSISAPTYCWNGPSASTKRASNSHPSRTFPTR